MLKILFKSQSKALVIVHDMRIYQNENLANKMVIRLPKEWYDYDLSLFTVSLYWVNAGNKAYVEMLEPSDELEKDGYLTYTLPLDSKFTQIAGENTIKLTMTWFNEEDNRSYKIESGELKIPILAQNEYFAYVPDTAFTSLNQKIEELKNIADQLSVTTENIPNTIPKDLEINDQVLQMVDSNGALMGEGVGISTAIEDVDIHRDAIIDLNTVRDDAEGPTSDSNIATDLTLNADLLQLLNENGSTMGNGVRIVVVPPDTQDSVNDGIYDLSGSNG